MRAFTRTAVVAGFVACILLSASILPAPDPIVGFSVGLEIGGTLAAFLTGVRDVGSRTDIVEHKIIGPGEQEIIEKVPGATRYLDIVAERGITSSLVLSDWRHQVEMGDVESARQDINLILYDMEYTEVARWAGTDCWPSAIDNLLPDDAGVAVEQLEIACDAVARVQ